MKPYSKASKNTKKFVLTFLPPHLHLLSKKKKKCGLTNGFSKLFLKINLMDITSIKLTVNCLLIWKPLHTLDSFSTKHSAVCWKFVTSKFWDDGINRDKSPLSNGKMKVTWSPKATYIIIDFQPFKSFTQQPIFS